MLILLLLLVLFGTVATFSRVQSLAFRGHFSATSGDNVPTNTATTGNTNSAGKKPRSPPKPKHSGYGNEDRNYLDPTNPTDGRPGVRKSSNAKRAGKALSKTSVSPPVNRKYAGRVGANVGNSYGGNDDRMGGDYTNNNHQISYKKQRLQHASYINSIGTFLSALSARTARTSFDFDSAEMSTLNMMVSEYVPGMSASQLAAFISHLGTFSQNNNQFTGRTYHLFKNDDTILKKLHSVSSTMSSKDMSMTIVGFARLNLDWKTCITNNKNRGVFVDRLSYVLQQDKLDTRTIGDILWGMGAMGTGWKELSIACRKTILKKFELKWKSFNSFSLSSILWALSKMGVQWNYFSQDVQDKMPHQIVKLSSSMSPQQSTKVIWALGTLKAKYTDLPPELFDMLINNVANIKRSKTGNSAISASQTLIGAAKLGVTFSSLSEPTRYIVLDQLLRVCQSSNDKGVTNSFWAMGTMSIPTNKALPLHVRSVMMESAARASTSCTAWAICNIVWGLAKMKFDWSDLTVGLQNAIIDNIYRLKNDMNGVDICILLWSLGAMNTPLDLKIDNINTLREALLFTFHENLDYIEAEELSKAIWGLSCCSVTWEMLPSHIHWKLNVALRRVGGNMSPQGVANCAYGFAILAFDYSQPSDAAFRGVHETLLNIMIKTQREKLGIEDGMFAYRKVREEAKRRRISSEGVGVASLDGGQKTPEYFDEERTVVREMTSDMDIDLDNMPVYVQDIDTDKILRLSDKEIMGMSEKQRQQTQEYEQIRIFAQYLKTMKFVTDLRRIPAELLAGSNVRTRSNDKASRLQRRVVRGLQRGLDLHMAEQEELHNPISFREKDAAESNDMISALSDPVQTLNRLGSTPITSVKLPFMDELSDKLSKNEQYTISLESSSFEGVFPVDAAIMRDGDVMALIEVNGPTHYRQDGRLKRKDQLKETLYRKRHPDSTFHRIRYDDENKIGSDAIGEELAALILTSIQDQSPLTKMMKDAMRNVGDFFSWSMRNQDYDMPTDENGLDIM
jgi:hypothetical protein